LKQPDHFQEALEALRGLGWKAELNARAAVLPKAVTARFPNLPPAVTAFLCAVKVCEREDERAWFLTAASFAARRRRDAFGWDEFERDELEGEYADRPDESRLFWDAHLPILQSVEEPFSVLAVVVDKASPSYGAVVSGDADDFHNTQPVAPSFEALLAMIARATPEGCDQALEPFLLHPDSEVRLRSAPVGGWSRWRQRLDALVRPESYRVCVVVETPMTRPLHEWPAWSRIMRPMSVVIGKLRGQAVISPRQTDRDDHGQRFGQPVWNEANNRRWVTNYLSDAAVDGEVFLHAVEVWSPSEAQCLATGRGPQMFCLLDRAADGTSQGFVLAIRKDVLRDVDVAADAVIFDVRSEIDRHRVEAFDRTWGETKPFHGLTTDGFDATGSRAVLDWVDRHPKAKRMSFRARHNRPR
jgi:hypothetical protein